MLVDFYHSPAVSFVPTLTIWRRAVKVYCRRNFLWKYIISICRKPIHNPSGQTCEGNQRLWIYENLIHIPVFCACKDTWKDHVFFFFKWSQRTYVNSYERSATVNYSKFFLLGKWIIINQRLLPVIADKRCNQLQAICQSLLTFKRGFLGGLNEIFF